MTPAHIKSHELYAALQKTPLQKKEKSPFLQADGIAYLTCAGIGIILILTGVLL